MGLRNLFRDGDKGSEHIVEPAHLTDFEMYDQVPVAGPNSRVAYLGFVAGSVTIVGDPRETHKLFLELAQEKISRGSV